MYMILSGIVREEKLRPKSAECGNVIFCAALRQTLKTAVHGGRLCADSAQDRRARLAGNPPNQPSSGRCEGVDPTWRHTISRISGISGGAAVAMNRTGRPLNVLSGLHPPPHLATGSIPRNPGTCTDHAEGGGGGL